MKKLIGSFLIVTFLVAGTHLLRRHQNKPFMSPAEQQTLRDAAGDTFGSLPGLDLEQSKKNLKLTGSQPPIAPKWSIATVRQQDLASDPVLFRTRNYLRRNFGDYAPFPDKLLPWYLGRLEPVRAGLQGMKMENAVLAAEITKDAQGKSQLAKVVLAINVAVADNGNLAENSFQAIRNCLKLDQCANEAGPSELRLLAFKHPQYDGSSSIRLSEGWTLKSGNYSDGEPGLNQGGLVLRYVKDGEERYGYFYKAINP